MSHSRFAGSQTCCVWNSLGFQNKLCLVPAPETVTDGTWGAAWVPHVLKAGLVVATCTEVKGCPAHCLWGRVRHHLTSSQWPPPSSSPEKAAVIGKPVSLALCLHPPMVPRGQGKCPSPRFFSTALQMPAMPVPPPGGASQHPAFSPPLLGVK